MKQILTILVLMILTLWYIRVGKESYHEKDNKEYLSLKEVRELHKKGIIGNIKYDRRYYSQQKVSYILSRTYIPFKYKRDTISNEPLTYYSEPLN